ncbi:ABC transporter permease [Pseudidiomarina sediminum]|uniref:ABC transporter permease n=1 Tax=Pseudidiomarina sediminum TaxID=431675 RepID=A0A432ZA26_9GAMM|nr:ABC transporter permease [Pseudidiomarina sediminum]RUO74807.1 ABC transporter permease [Pseudidiomarina sediminum]
MSRWSQVRRIGGFEFRRFFKWKQELFSLVLMAALFGASFGWSVLKDALEETQQIAVTSEVRLPELRNIAWDYVPASEQLTQQLGERYNGILHVVSSPEQGYGAQLTVTSSAGWQDRLEAQLQQWLQQQKMRALPLSESDIVMLNTPIAIDVTVQRESTDEVESQSTGKAISSIILVSIMVGVFGSFGLMMTAITQEKQQRVTEQLLTLITPSEWMDGKILGITLHSLKSMATVVIIMLLVTVLFTVIGGDALSLPAISASGVILALLFALVGLVMINAMMAGFAATIDDPNHSGRPVVMLIPGLFVAAGFGVMDSLQGVLAQFLSWFPLTSFAVMPLRVADGGVVWWEWAGSLVLLLLTTYVIRSAAIRVFRLGITMYGKEPSWRHIGRALIGR